MTNETEAMEMENLSELSSSDAEAPEIDAPEFEAEGSAGDAPEAEAPTADRMTKDAFFGTFRALWTTPNMALFMAGEMPLEALNIPETDQDAREASDALYDTIAEIPAMQWLLNPASKWMQRVIVIGSFAAPRIMAAMSEWEGRKADKPANPIQNVHAANDDDVAPEPPSGPIVQPVSRD
ncbi:hypothetical protein [Pyruvatibacter mobilis]|uniref:hypothetical protein n=1 Tax=Pyruvatibacter mobilis TaxID=1712261 RepID=UPI003BAD9101